MGGMSLLYTAEYQALAISYAMASLQAIRRRAGASIWLALLFLFAACLADDHPNSSVPLGSYLPPAGSTNPVVLVSPNSMFQLIVKTWSNSSASYCMAGVRNAKIDANPMMWGANNAQPLQVASSCTLYLSEEGDLLLQDDSKYKTAWQTHTAGMGVSNLSLFDSGNLVLLTKQGLVAWQSFAQSPAFDLYSGMNLTSNMTILSGSPVPEARDFNVPGKFGMELHNHSKLVLLDETSRFVYWSISNISGAEQVSYITLDTSGFTFHDNSSKALGSVSPTVTNVSSDFSLSTKVALFDSTSGDLVARYWSNASWLLFFNSSIPTCAKPSHCGNFSMCNASTGACSCPTGFVTQDGLNCELESKNAFPSVSCPSSADTLRSYSFVSVNVSVEPQMSAVPSDSVENCSLLCRQNCTCRAALYDPDTGSCSLFSRLQTVPVKADSKQQLLLKLSAHHKKHNLVKVLCAAISMSLCSAACVIVVLYCSRQRKVRSRESQASTGEVLLQGLPRLPPKYAYKELETATEGFSTKLGAGGFGAVYEGVLLSGVKVAVKRLADGSEQSMVQFRAEVASIGSISHMNLVTLKGFCYEREGRLLVYEHMANGSLDRWLFKKGEVELVKKLLGWERRCKIAMDTAKGLAYLHHECGERIVHCDVKPENILLDEQFDAKVGDFGLAKLMGREHQSFAMTTLKGTRGYLAPEWLQDATITAKSDVYSFGVVLLELISGRRCLDSDYGCYLITFAFRIVSASATESKETIDDESPLVRGPQYTSPSKYIAYDYTTMKELLDPCLFQDVDVTPVSLERMIFTGLWCVQPSPATRPAMNVVVQMLEGLVAVPPPPFA